MRAARICGGAITSAPAIRIAFQTLNGVYGVSSAWMPSGPSASMTALAMVGIAPVVPASPAPFTPSGLLGDSVGRSSILRSGGNASARGMK